MFAIGASLRLAVLMSSYRFSAHDIGVLSMLIGASGFALSLAYWESWGGFSGLRHSPTTLRVRVIARRSNNQYLN
jgi:hypothetical protein